MKLMKWMALVAVAGLTACGSGSDGGSSGPIALTGTAAKGLLKGADVQAYEVVGGKLSKYGAAVKTDTSGAYELSLSPTSNPVIVEITANADTKMLDETTVTGGKYAEVAAPSGLSLRTMVASLTETAVAEANPYTEMAVAGAVAAVDASGNAVPLTKDVLLTAKENIRTQLKINPFAAKAVDADATDVTDAQKQLMTLLAGVAKSAKDDTSCDLKCQIKKMNDAAVITYDAAAGKGLLKNPTATKDLMTAISTKAATVNHPMKVALPTYAVLQASDIATGSELAARDSFESFVTVMREGVNTAQKKFDEATKDLETRTKDLTYKTAKAGMDAFDAASANCEWVNGKLSCTGTDVTKISDGTYSLSYTSGSYKNVATATGSISGGVGTLSITNAKTTALSNNKVYGEMSMSVTLTGLDSNNKLSKENASAVFNMSVTGYDDQTQAPVTVSLNNLNATLTNRTKLIGGGSVLITNTLGDKVEGAITKLTVVKLGPDANNEEEYGQDLEFNVTAYTANKKLFSLGASASVDYTSYKPWLSDSATNYGVGKANMNVAFVQDSVSLDVTANVTGYQKSDMTVVFKSGGKSMTATAKLTEDANGKVVVDSNGIDFTSSSNEFTANIKKVNGKNTGSIKKGDVVVGTIEDGIVKINGIELSLK